MTIPLPTMVPGLQSILLAELARGNKIREVGDWPPKCRLFVLLERPFKKKHALAPGVVFEKLDDPHYWQAEYRYDDGIECLACGFGGG